MNATKEEIIKEFETIYMDKNKLTTLVSNINLKRQRIFNDKLLNLHSAMEIIHIVFYKLITFERKWNKSLLPKFEDIFIFACNSEINNIANKDKKYIELNTHVKNDAGYEDEEADILLNHKEIAENFNDPFKDEITNICYDLLGDEQDKLVFLLRNEGMTNKEIATEININIKDVENTVKRIKRVLRPFLIKNEWFKIESKKVLDN